MIALYNTETLMYNIKIYDKNWTFKTTLSEKLVSCNYSFSATVGWGFSSFNFEYYGKKEINHRDRIKVYKKWEAIYQGFVVGVNFLEDTKGKRKAISCNGIIGILSFDYATDGTKNNDPKILIENLFAWLWFDLSGVKAYWKTINMQITNKTKHQYLQDILKNSPDYYFFIDENNKVFFDNYGTQYHQLTFDKDVFSIQIKENSSQYYNKVKVSYDWWYVIEENQEEINNYWLCYIKISDTAIKNEATAELRAKSLLQEKSIKKNCNIAVNNAYKFEKIKPWHIVSVRNTNRIIENKKVKQVQYNQDTAILTLDSYESLEKFISENNQNV